MHKLFAMMILVTYLIAAPLPVRAETDGPTEQEVAFLQLLASCEAEYETTIPQTIRGVLWNPLCCLVTDDTARLACLETSLAKMKDLQRHMQDIYTDASTHSNDCGPILANTCSIVAPSSIDDYLGEITCNLNSYNKYQEGLTSCVEGNAGAQLN